MALIDLTLTESLAALDSGNLTSVALAEALIKQSDKMLELNAFMSLNTDAVLVAANAADISRAKGNTAPLMGIFISFKDNVACAGYPMTANTPALAQFHPNRNASLAQMLIDAGAIVFGKTGLHELAFGGTSNNKFGGAIHNAHSLGRIPAGSSGGSAAAVGGRIVAAAIGSDTGGSIRVPAAFNGVCGFRPSTGRWPSNGVLPLSHTRDTLGPLARSVADLDLLDSVVTSRPLTLAADLSKLTFGKPTGFYWDDLAPDVQAVCDVALTKIENAGATIREIDLTVLTQRVQDIAFPIVFYEAGDALQEFLEEWETGIDLNFLFDSIASPDVAKVAAQLRDPAATLPERLYHQMVDINIPAIGQDFEALMAAECIDALVYPTAPLTAPSIGEDDTTELNGRQVPTFQTVIRNMDIGSIIALPSVSLPAGVDRQGLPIGLSIEGVSGQDERLLSISMAVEAALPSIPALN